MNGAQMGVICAHDGMQFPLRSHHSEMASDYKNQAPQWEALYGKAHPL